MRERDREKEIVAPFILIAPKKIIISYYLVFVSGHDELKMEHVENPGTKASYRKRLKSWGYIWTRWKEKKPTGPVHHLMHAGWDTRSDPAQRLPAGPDRPSLGWWALNRSDPGKNKSLFFILIFPELHAGSIRLYPHSVTSSPIRAADELSECSSHIVVIMTNLLLVYASDEWLSFNYL